MKKSFEMEITETNKFYLFSEIVIGSCEFTIRINKFYH